MIRINLLSEGRRPVVARKAKAKLSFGDVDPSGPILLAGLVVGLIVFGVWWYIKTSALEEANQKVARAQREVEELRPIIEEVEAFKAKQSELERKITVIKDLKAAQAGPVELMDKVSRALPDLLWLESMRVTGSTVSINGQALNTNAIAAFIENLDKVPEFEEPDTRDVSKVSNGYKFQLTFKFEFKVEKPAEDSGEAAS